MIVGYAPDTLYSDFGITPIPNRYEERLPEHIQGSTRSAILQLFQQWKGADYAPAKMDGLLRWSAKDPLVLDSAIDSPWQIIDKHKGSTGSPLRKDNTSYVPAKVVRL